MVGILLSYWRGLFSGSMWIFRGVHSLKLTALHPWKWMLGRWIRIPLVGFGFWLFFFRECNGWTIEVFYFLASSWWVFGVVFEVKLLVIEGISWICNIVQARVSENWKFHWQPLKFDIVLEELPSKRKGLCSPLSRGYAKLRGCIVLKCWRCSTQYENSLRHIWKCPIKI